MHVQETAYDPTKKFSHPNHKFHETLFTDINPKTMCDMQKLTNFAVWRIDFQESRLEICQKIYTTEDFGVKNLHRKRVIFDIC